MDYEYEHKLVLVRLFNRYHEHNPETGFLELKADTPAWAIRILKNEYMVMPTA